MPAANPWMYRTRRGRFTKRRKGTRRTWVPAPGRSRRRGRRPGGRGRYSKMPAGLRRYLLAKMRGRRPTKRRRSSGKRRKTAGRYGYGPKGYRSWAKKKLHGTRKHRWKYGRDVHGKRKRYLDSYGPQLPSTAGQRRQYYVGVARAARQRRRYAGPRPANDNAILYDQHGRRVAGNPRRRRKMRRYATTVNPRRRRVRGFRRVRRHMYTRNPGMGSIVQMAKSAIFPAGAGLAGGFVSGLIDSKIVPKKRLIQSLLKFGAGLAGAFVFRRNAAAAGAFIGSTIGTIGYGIGMKMGGGMVANSKGEALAGIADMAAEDPELANLISNAEDLGDLVTAGELADGEVELADDEDVADLVAE